MAFPKGLSRLGGNQPDAAQGAQKPAPRGFTGGEKGESQTTITHHGDGTHSSQHADMSTEEHPDHLHLLASLGHKLSGGDKHHVVQDKGGSFAQHGVEESGEHYGTHDHDTVEELKGSMGKFLGGEGDEADGEGRDAQAPEDEEESYGGLRK